MNMLGAEGMDDDADGGRQETQIRGARVAGPHTSNGKSRPSNKYLKGKQGRHNLFLEAEQNQAASQGVSRYRVLGYFTRRATATSSQ